jgi:autotransporter passenger strand-loop-strand repeat protein
MTIDTGGTAFISSGGLALSGILYGTEYVSAGGTATGIQVLSGGVQNVVVRRCRH